MDGIFNSGIKGTFGKKLTESQIRDGRIREDKSEVIDNSLAMAPSFGAHQYIDNSINTESGVVNASLTETLISINNNLVDLVTATKNFWSEFHIPFIETSMAHMRDLMEEISNMDSSSSSDGALTGGLLGGGLGSLFGKSKGIFSVFGKTGALAKIGGPLAVVSSFFSAISAFDKQSERSIEDIQKRGGFIASSIRDFADNLTFGLTETINEKLANNETWHSIMDNALGPAMDIAMSIFDKGARERTAKRLSEFDMGATLVKFSDFVDDFTGGLVTRISDGLSNNERWTGLIDTYIGPTVDVMLSAFDEGARERVSSRIGKLKDSIMETVDVIWSTITDSFKLSIESVKSKISGVWDNTTSVFENTVDSISDSITSRFNNLFSRAENSLGEALDGSKPQPTYTKDPQNPAISSIPMIQEIKIPEKLFDYELFAKIMKEAMSNINSSNNTTINQGSGSSMSSRSMPRSVDDPGAFAANSGVL